MLSFLETYNIYHTETEIIHIVLAFHSYSRDSKRCGGLLAPLHISSVCTRLYPYVSRAHNLFCSPIFRPKYNWYACTNFVANHLLSQSRKYKHKKKNLQNVSNLPMNTLCTWILKVQYSFFVTKSRTNLFI